MLADELDYVIGLLGQPGCVDGIRLANVRPFALVEVRHRQVIDRATCGERTLTSSLRKSSATSRIGGVCSPSCRSSSTSGRSRRTN